MDHKGTPAHGRSFAFGTLLRTIALGVALALMAAPMLQSELTCTMMECGSKPPPILEEEVHKSVAPIHALLTTPASTGEMRRSDPGPSALPLSHMEVITPPPDAC